MQDGAPGKIVNVGDDKDKLRVSYGTEQGQQVCYHEQEIVEGFQEIKCYAIPSDESIDVLDVLPDAIEDATLPHNIEHTQTAEVLETPTQTKQQAHIAMMKQKLEQYETEQQQYAADRNKRMIVQRWNESYHDWPSSKPYTPRVS